MTSFNGTVGGSQISDILQSGNVTPLSDIYEIESIVFAIKEIQKQIESHKILKNKRILAIDSEVNRLNSKIDFLKSIISSTLKQHNQKSLKLPGVGSVSQRKPKSSYEIIDQDALFELLKKENEYDNIVEVKIDNVVKKHDLNKLLSIWSNIDKLPKCVKEEKDTDSITLKFDDEIDTISLEDKANVQKLADLDF